MGWLCGHYLQVFLRGLYLVQLSHIHIMIIDCIMSEVMGICLISDDIRKSKE